MSGLGILYAPPLENVPIFDGLLFLIPLLEPTASLQPIVPSPAGAYLNSNITVNNYGQVTTASNGQSIPPLNPSPAGTYEISENADISVTQFGQVIAVSAGYLNPDPTGTFTNATVQVNKFGQVLSASSGTPAIPLTPTGVVAAPYTNTNLTVNTYGQITSASNGTAGIPATPTITAGTTNFTQDGSVTYNQYGQITSATSGVIPSFAGGNFQNPTLTVNTYGQITSITSGTGTLIQPPTYIQSSLSSTVSGTFTLPPAGAKTMKVVCISAGGVGGGVFYDSSTTSVNGAGFGGAYTSFTFECSQWNTLASPMLAYYNLGASISGNFPSNCPVVFWTPYAGSIYPQDIANPPLAPPLGNGYSGNGQVSMPSIRSITTSTANYPYNMYQADLMTSINAPQAYTYGTVVVPTNGNYGEFKWSNGTGAKCGTIQPTSSVNQTVLGGGNALAENSYDANIIAPWAKGQSYQVVADPSNPSVPIITVTPQGQGGWAIYFYG